MKIHHLKGYIQNIYIVEESEKLMLLDGCSRADIQTITNFITKELKKPLDSLKVIVVTHMHPDHAGAAHKLRRISSCKILTGPSENHWYQGFIGKLMFITDILLTWYVAKKINKPLKNILYSPYLKPDKVLLNNQIINDFPDWKILTTPGHTDRDITVYHEKSNSAYVADLVVNLRNKIISPFPVFHPNKYKESLIKIDELTIKTLYLAHGQPLTSGMLKLIEEVHEVPQKPKTHWRAIKMKFNKIWEKFR